MSKAELLELNTSSVQNWILLQNYLESYWDVDIFKKIIDSFYNQLPLFTVEYLYESISRHVDADTFQALLDFLFQKNGQHILTNS